MCSIIAQHVPNPGMLDLACAGFKAIIISGSVKCLQSILVPSGYIQLQPQLGNIHPTGKGPQGTLKPQSGVGL